MEDRPETPDLPTLTRKAYLTWNEVDGLLFYNAFKRISHGNYKKRESLKNARKGVRDLFEDALLNGELKGESSTRGNIPIYRKIKKGEMCAWFMGKRILDLLEDKGIEVPTENVEFIEESSKEKDEAEAKLIKQKKKNSPIDDLDFPPNLQHWGQVTFCALDGGELEITAKGKPFQGDVLISKKMPKYLYAFLFNIALKGGNFDKSSLPDLKLTNISSFVGKLNKHLKEIFEINEKPIIYNRPAKSYQSAFKVESDINQKTFSLEGNTPAGVRPPKTKSAKNFDSYQ